MRFVSWNVNGLRAVLKKDFAETFDVFDADIFAVQETKCQDDQVEIELPDYYQYWSSAEKKGYAGTAVFCKEKPLRVLHGLGVEDLDREGRIVALEFEDFWFVDVYTPNAQNELARIDHRMAWDDAFREFCKGLEEGVLPAGVPVEYPENGVAEMAAADATGSLECGIDAADATGKSDAVGAAAGEADATSEADAAAGAVCGANAVCDMDKTDDMDGVGKTDKTVEDTQLTQPGETCTPKPVVICGDFNVAHQEIDLKNPDPNRGNAGFSDEEREKFSELLEAGFADTFRRLHPDLIGAYSWWSYRFNARKNNAGWRIDYFLVSEELVSCIESASIYNEVMGSDHCPVGIELDLDSDLNP